MKPKTVFLLAAGVLSAAPACTSQDSLLDALGTGGDSPTSGGTATNGGTSGHDTGGAAATAGTNVTGGVGGVSSGSGGSAEGGEGATGGDSGAASGGAAGDTGGSGGSSGAPCGEVTTLAECETRIDCHSVFYDPADCNCLAIGCCARFERCADGDLADCEGRNVNCEAMTPHCEGPAYVVSAAGFCYEGCVQPKDCAPKTCSPPDDPTGCFCYSNADCAAGQNCYSAECASNLPGRCNAPPPSGCYGDVDCPSGQRCMGGSLAACGTSGPDSIGTCVGERCPEGDCPGAGGPTCTCESSGQCVAATGPTGSGMCRNADGTCSACKCAAPDTPVATPSGERPMAELRAGDLVYSVDGAAIRAVPILRVNRTPVVNHRVLRVTLENGRSLEMTAGHPLPDGRPLSSLFSGSELLGGTVGSVVSIPYAHDATYDILPASTSGAYFASGVLIGSTLSTAARGDVARCGTTITE